VDYPGNVSDLAGRLRDGGYLADRGLATTMLVALSLGRPVLLEGEVGVGKTEVAKVLADVFGRTLIRLQCYEGITTSQPRRPTRTRLTACSGLRSCSNGRCWRRSGWATVRSC
jgi:hypothetical protein